MVSLILNSKRMLLLLIVKKTDRSDEVSRLLNAAARDGGDEL